MTKKDIPFRLRVSPDPSQIIAADTENVYRYELSELTSEDICFDEFGRIWVTKTEPNPRPELMQVDFIDTDEPHRWKGFELPQK